MGQLWSRRILAAATALALSTVAGCTASLKENADASITRMISGVTDGSGSVHAELVKGSAPQASGGPAATVGGVAVMINGGSSQQAVNGTASFDRVIVSISGLDDYYELTLPASTTTENLVISANPDAYPGRLTFKYAVASGTSFGPYAVQSVRFLRVGTGDIQISVAWTDSADVDLHVIDPNDEEIFYGHAKLPEKAASGGFLDLDANSACRKNDLSDGTDAFVSNENVVWPIGKSIPGTYKVVLDYWSDCGAAKTDWVVTVSRVGAASQIFTGTFTGPSTGVPDAMVYTFTQ